MSSVHPLTQTPKFHNPLDEVRKMTEELGLSHRKDAQLLTQQHVKALTERVSAIEAQIAELKDLKKITR